MKTSRRWIATSVLALCACSAPPPPPATADASTDASVESTKATVAATTAAFHQALRTDDVEKFMSYVADDVILAPPGEEALRGKEAVRRWYSAFVSAYHTASLTLADQEVLVGGEWAVERGTYEWGLTPAAGGTVAVDKGHYLQVWQKQPDGRWQFAREVYNSSIPVTAPAAK